MALFGQNELNAVSQADAARQLAKYAKILEDGQSSNATLAGRPSFSDQQRDQMIREAMLTADGKVALGQSMALPIRRNLDYSGVARRGIIVDPLAQGVIPTYERDIDVHATVVSSNGTVPESIIRGDRVTVPEFVIMSNPLIRIDEVRMRRFNVVERAVQKASQEIKANEDANFFAALDFASDVSLNGENTAQDITDAGTTVRDLVEIKSQVDRWDLWTSKFFMSISEFNDILLWSSAGGTVANVDPVTHRELLQTGLMGRIFGADIIVSKMVPAGTIFAVADPEFVGVMPVRSEIECLPADEPKRLSIGFVCYEQIGLALTNPRSVAAGRKNVVPNV